MSKLFGRRHVREEVHVVSWVCVEFAEVKLVTEGEKKLFVVLDVLHFLALHYTLVI